MEAIKSEAIENFCAITGSWDIDSAIEYLTRHNWDATTASMEFLSIQGSLEPQSSSYNTNYVDRDYTVPEAFPAFESRSANYTRPPVRNTEYVDRDFTVPEASFESRSANYARPAVRNAEYVNRNHLASRSFRAFEDPPDHYSSVNPHSNNVPEPENPAPPQSPGIFSRLSNFIGSSISSIYNSVIPKSANNAFVSYIQSLQSSYKPRLLALDFERAAEFASDRNKTLLLYIHNVGTPDSYILDVLCCREVSQIINENFLFWGCMGNTSESKEILEVFFNGLPTTFALIDAFNHQSISRIPGLPSKQDLILFLLQSAPVGASNSNLQAMQDRLIRQQQEKELRDAEIIAKKKSEEEKIKKEKIAKEKEEEEAKKIQEEAKKQQEKQKINEKLMKIGEEPPLGSNCAQIAFRLPSGEKIERKLYENTEIETMYLFLETQGHKNIEIITGFPTKVLKEGTLKTEGLVPRGLLHVRSIN
jgi:UBA-like domain/UBX domain